MSHGADPSEPVWRGGARTCWYGQVQGPGSDYSDVCRVAVMDATPSGFQLGFSDGYVAPGGKCRALSRAADPLLTGGFMIFLTASSRAGNSLVGGENGVLGTISHIYYIPLNAAAFGVKQAVCQERDNSTVVYSVSQGRIGAAVPPPAQPPPAAAHVAAAKDGAMGSGGLASVSTAALVHPVGTTGFATAGGGAAAAGSSSGSLPQQQPRAAVPPQSTGGPAKELIPPPPPPNKAAVNNPLTGGWMANPFIGG